MIESIGTAAIVLVLLAALFGAGAAVEALADRRKTVGRRRR